MKRDWQVVEVFDNELPSTMHHAILVEAQYKDHAKAIAKTLEKEFGHDKRKFAIRRKWSIWSRMINRLGV